MDISLRYEDCVEILLKHGARVDVEARMCWPGSHNPTCEERGKFSEYYHCNYVCFLLLLIF